MVNEGVNRGQVPKFAPLHGALQNFRVTSPYDAEHELALYANNIAVLASPVKPRLGVGYLQTAIEELEHGGSKSIPIRVPRPG